MTDEAEAGDVRPSPIAGTWYPENPARLKESIDHYLEASAPADIEGEICGIVVPHAGHRYSGQVAAYAFRCLRNLSPRIVAVVSPMHLPLEGKVITTAHDAYETPLGIIPVHREKLEQFANLMWERHKVHVAQARNDSEHSLEIELPFLQRVLNESFSLLPIMIRDQSRATVEQVGHTLAEVLRGDSTILVASSDLSHFYSETIAQQLDSELLSRVERFDPAGVLSAEDEGVGFACGRGAIAAVLWASRDLGADAIKVLHHATSGQVTSDYSSVVGYGAAVIYKQRTLQKKPE